ncbi:carboxymuconolactone decarboxylase family protein [Micromonospora sp. NPDC050980]|uniref:carboxymuconolactone decarboxylase family protein n=1 Tax=Micromonospora sp. NPDC050980 TaxID=3155161 RepID=UPI0033CAA60E
MIAGRVVSSVVQRQVHHVTPVAPADAVGLVAMVYEQVADEMRLVVPPALLHSPAPETLAAYWVLSREPLIGAHGDARVTKEAVAAAVSVANICPYCVDMHSAGMYDLTSAQDAEAIAGDRVEEITDPKLRAVSAWARTLHQPDDRAPVPDGTGPAEYAELLGVAVSYHYVARMVNVFLASFLLPPGLGPRSRQRLKRGIGHVLGPTLREPRRPGRSLNLLTPAPLPADAGWAAGSRRIADAVARAYAAFERAGAHALSPAVRALVTERLSRWRGEDSGLSARWCEEAIADLPDADRAAARLALLTALASYRVDDEVVDEFRRHHPDDTILVEAAAWASFAAARQIGARAELAPTGADQGAHRS